jgi:type IV secretion system protein TrbI
MAANVGENINSVGSQITRKNLDIQPTLKILAGKKVNVLVNKDMVLTPYEEKG